jgi:hypothetical protein
MAAMKKTSNLKEHVMNYKTICFGAAADPRHLGIHILSKTIPKMYETGDMAFAWLWRLSDVGIYNQAEYETEVNTYQKTHKMKKCDGDTTWFYEFKKDGVMRKAVITTEIWFKPGEQHQLSPIAQLLGQFCGHGLHISKVKFETV